MKATLQPGATARLTFKVPAEKTVPNLYPESADFRAMPQVFATGFMVGLMEWCCLEALKPHLDPGEGSLGIHINVSHSAATVPGQLVTVDCECTGVSGRRVAFKVTAHDGVEVMTEGDSFFVVFKAPAAAVSAAAQGQRLLEHEPWPPGGEIHVRMGMHTGEAVLGGDNYVGLDVHRAARVAAAGHGGQVLISESTRVLADRALPEGTHLKDLGSHRLKDLPTPEHIYQLVIDGVAADFPPIRSLDARPNNLPAADGHERFPVNGPGCRRSGGIRQPNPSLIA